MTDQRAVITGIGPVSSLGLGKLPLQTALQNAQAGVQPMTKFDPGPLGFELVAEIPEFKVADYLFSAKTYLDHTTEVAFAAARLAVDDAGLTPDDLAELPTGISTGTAFGSMQTATDFFAGFLEKGPRLVKPLLFPNAYSNTTASMLAIEYEARGPHFNFASGFVAGSQAVLTGVNMIKTGRCETCLVGGFDTLSDYLLTGCELAGWVAEADANDSNATRAAPFDVNCQGFNPGEAGAILVLESLQHARKRGARIYGEISGFAESNATKPENLWKAVKTAMIDASGHAQPDVILANANGMPALDAAEGQAITNFKKNIAATAIKAQLGETFAAAGPLQVTAGACMLENNFIPATLNTQKLPSTYSFDLVRETRPSNHASCILMNTIDPGGGTVCLALSRV